MNQHHHTAALTKDQVCSITRATDATIRSMTQQFDAELEAMAIKYRNVPPVMESIKAAQHARKPGCCSIADKRRKALQSLVHDRVKCSDGKPATAAWLPPETRQMILDALQA